MVPGWRDGRARIAATSADRPIHVVVDHDGVEPVGERLLGLGLGDPAGQLLRRRRCPGPEPRLAAPSRVGRPQEDQQRVGDLLPDRQGALDVDLEQHVPAGARARPRPAPAGVPFSWP